MTSLSFCFPTTFYPPYSFGGDAIAVQRLARALVRRGHSVTVVHDVDAFLALSGGKEPSAPVLGDGAEIISLRSAARRLSPLLAQQTGQPTVHRRTLKHLFDERKFDVVNFHNASLMGGPGIFGLAAASTTVYMAHEHWLVCPTHVLWRHKREVCPKRQCIRCQLRYKRPPQIWRYGPRLKDQLGKIDLYLAMSRFSAAKHAEFGFPFPMEVLPPFADEPPEENASPRPHERPYFLFAGRLEAIKGLQTVIPFLPEVPEVDLLIAGEGSFRPELEQIAGPQVRFLGRTSGPELIRYYRHALGTLAPSITFETFGLTLIESFACSVPVVARRLGPFPEIIERCEGGLLFSSPPELISAMKSIANDPVLRRRLSENARAGYLSAWCEEAVVPRYLELVTAAMGRR